MDSGFITLMRKLAPDLIDEITRRALILERIAALQPVGRRQLAAKLNLPEREIRNTAAILKDLGYVDLDASGMSLSGKAEEVLEASRAFSKAMSGLTETEKKLCELLPADRVLIAPGNADEDEQVLSDVGRICATRLRSILVNGNTLAVTGLTSGSAIWIDAETMEVWNADRSATITQNSAGEFPVLAPGSNTLTFSGCTSIEIRKRERFL